MSYEDKSPKDATIAGWLAGKAGVFDFNALCESVLALRARCEELADGYDQAMNEAGLLRAERDAYAAELATCVRALRRLAGTVECWHNDGPSSPDDPITGALENAGLALSGPLASAVSDASSETQTEGA